LYKALKIKEITLTNFRTYEKQHVFLGPGVHFMVGENGAGKTNFLEAIYVLGLAKSYKADDDELIRYMESFAKINAVVDVDGKDRSMSIILSEVGKKAMVNQTEIKRLSDYIGLLTVVAFTPDSMNLIKGAPVNRRSFLDIFLGQSDKQYFVSLTAYKHVLRQRNELLKHFLNHHTYDETLLAVLTEQLCQAAEVLVEKRKRFLEVVREKASLLYHMLTGRDNQLDLTFHPSIADHFVTVMQGKQKSDLLQGTTNFGPHRDDFDFQLNGQTAKSFASQGEQRLIVLSVTLALVEYMHEKTSETPVLLLDDVFSELDHDKQNRLIQFLLDSNVQVIITTTTLAEISQANRKKSRHYQVSKGRIKEERQHG